MVVRRHKDRPIGPDNCIWRDGRWQLRGRGIHAGDGLYMRAATLWGEPDDEGRQARLGPGAWLRVRVESADAGRVLVAHYFFHGIMFTVRLTPEHELAWDVVGMLRRPDDCLECGHARGFHDLMAATCSHHNGADTCECAGYMGG